jgi:hypothetical protein
MTRHTPPAPALVNATADQLETLEQVAAAHDWREIEYDAREERQRRVFTEARRD